MPNFLQNPEGLKWIEGELPEPDTVRKDLVAIVWIVHDVPPEEQQTCFPKTSTERNGMLRSITTARQWSNELNPVVRWCDLSGMPLGFWSKVKYYAWLNE